MGIILPWGVGVAICLERLAKLKKADVDGASFMNEIQRHILSNDIQGAIRICSGSMAALPRVLKVAPKSEAISGTNSKCSRCNTLEVIPKLN